MALPKKPTNLYVQNGWYLELPGLVSPHFEKLSGLSRKTGKVEIVDGGSNIKYHFNAQILDFGAITLERTLDGSSDDYVMDSLVAASQTTGAKYSGVLVKLHFNVRVFSIAFDGICFMEDNYTDFDVNGENKMIKSYPATIDTWIKIP